MSHDNNPPFAENVQLERSLDGFTTTKPIPHNVILPGFPRIKLHDTEATMEHLRKELWCERLEPIAKHLWLMSTRSSNNITPLHRQSLRGRNIIVMEDPGLHLTWSHNQIFIKPLPRYLLSYAFWDQYLLVTTAQVDTDREALVRASLGLLRTYYHLIQHESDFNSANNARLLPEDVNWEEFCRFSETFSNITDKMVSKRYEYGELRLSRLNLWAILLLRKTAYQDQGLQYSDYFAPYYGPLLFMFGVFSVLLSAMQVGLAAEALDAQGWFAFENVSRWFAVLSIVISIAPVIVLVLVLLVKVVDECVFALKRRFVRQSCGTQFYKSSRV